MKAAVFNGNDITLKEVSKPIPKKNQVLIHVRAAGICGTDVAITRGLLTNTPVPLILGHEFAGYIVAVGPEVDSSWIGRRVTAEINTATCGLCYFCLKDIKTQCNERKSLGIHVDGAFAEYLAIEVDLLHELPKSISYPDATIIEPLAAAYQTFVTMPLSSDDKSIVIFGTGKMGLLILQIAKAKGLEVIAVAGTEKKLELANKLGASEIINRYEIQDIAREIMDITDGIGADIVVDVTGNPKALQQVVSSCRALGKLHIKSTYGVTPINLRDIVMREITVYTSRCGPFQKAIDGLESRTISTNDFITRVYNLTDVKEAFDTYGKDEGHIRTIIMNE
ncbi:MAG: zinc-dependent alcohol dehydrogenase [Candidatus Hodarchaeales archaeon]|jgi:threonine dehydrogenase-like Zn-dependent dehydrogenase